MSEIMKLRKPNTRDFVEAVDESEGFERGNEFLREVERGNGTVDEVKGGESRERFEGSEGERKMGGAVRKS